MNRTTPVADRAAPGDPPLTLPAPRDAPQGALLEPLDAVLAPRSVAIIGASADPGKRGYQALRALLEDGYAGAIHPVHPSGGELLGLPVARSLEELPRGIDLALVCTPASTVPGVIDACGAAGIRGAVVLALGFGEIGGEGARLERELRDAIERTGVRVVGPNTSGISNPWLKLSLHGMRGLRAGGLAVLAQSGNVLLGMMLEAQARPGIGFSSVIGIGNGVDLGPAEYLTWLARDERTRAVALYLEGLGDGVRFLDAAAEAAAHKPVLLLKGGRSAAGRAAALSHTGALAGEHLVLQAGAHDAGVFLLDRSDELFAVAGALLSQPAAGGGIAILSDGGGHATLASDCLAELDATSARLDPATGARLRARLGSTASVVNPVDVAGATDRDPVAFADTVDILLDDPGVACIVVVGLFGGYALRFAAALADAESEAARRMAAAARAAGKGLIVHTMYADAESRALQLLRESGVPVCASLEAACRAAVALQQRPAAAKRAAHRSHLVASHGGRTATTVAESGGAGASAAGDARAARTDWLLEPELRSLAESYGVVFAPATFCTTAEAVTAAASSIDGPFAIRVVAHGVSHKTEAGGVRLNVPAGAAATAFEEIRAAVLVHAADGDHAAGLAGVMIGPMLQQPVAELLVGVRNDPVFGPVLVVGAGGTAVEVLQDVAVGVPPLDEEGVRRLLGSLRIAPLLRGWRGAPAADEAAVARVALALLACVQSERAVAELELNPVFVFPDGAYAMDIRGVR